MAYELDWSTSNTVDELTGKTRITLQPNTTNTNATSLTLFGKGAPNYGEGQQENFLRILENFAAKTAPTNPTIGQLWYDINTSRLNILNTSQEWVPISGVFISETAPPSPFLGQLWFKDSTNNFFIFAGDGVWVPLDNNPMIRVAYNYEYNRLVDQYNTIVASNTTGTDCSNSAGWNQANKALGKLYIPANPVTNPIWVNLLEKWKEIATVVGVDRNKFNSNGFIIHDQYHIDETLGPTGEGKGITTISMEYERVVDAAGEVFANRFNIAPQYLEMQVYPTFTDGAHWSDKAVLNLEFEWPSVDAMDFYFRTGGYIKLTPVFQQQTADYTSAMWSTLIAKLNGGIIIRACSTLDLSGNPNYSTYRSVFTLPDTTSVWPADAIENSVGRVLYKAHESFSILNPYTGYTGSGTAGSTASLTFDGIGVAGTTIDFDGSNLPVGATTDFDGNVIIPGASGGSGGGSTTATLTFAGIGVSGTTTDFTGSNLPIGSTVDFNGNVTIPGSGSSSGLAGYSSGTGDDGDPGWGDITVEARRKTAERKLQVRLVFDNETHKLVKGILSVNVSSHKVATQAGTFTFDPTPVHPTLANASPNIWVKSDVAIAPAAAPLAVANPTVNSLSTSIAKPVISGTWPSAGAQSLAVSIAGSTFIRGSAAALTTSGNNWSLDLAQTSVTLSNGYYNVTASIIKTSDGLTLSDTSNNEVFVSITPVADTTPPTAPTVTSLSTTTPNPSISGTYPHLDSAGGFQVAINGYVYKLNSSNIYNSAGTTVVANATSNPISTSGSSWTLDLSKHPSLSLTPGTYSVIASATDAAGNVAHDVTNNEIVIQTPLPPMPGVPTVTAGTFTTTSPLISGTYDSALTNTLTVTINGWSYTPGSTTVINSGGTTRTSASAALSASGGNWSLNLVNDSGNALTFNTTYNVTVAASNAGGTRYDNTTNEIVVNPPPAPAAPTVTAGTFNVQQPTISGTFNSAQTSTLSITINGKTYTTPSAAISASGNSWSLNLTADSSNVLAWNTIYSVTATATNVGGSTSDGTSNEISIVAPPASYTTTKVLTVNDGYVSAGYGPSAQWMHLRTKTYAGATTIEYQLYADSNTWYTWNGTDSHNSSTSYGTGWRDEGELYRITSLSLSGGVISGTVSIWDAFIGWRYNGVGFSVAV